MKLGNIARSLHGPGDRMVGRFASSRLHGSSERSTYHRDRPAWFFFLLTPWMNRRSSELPKCFFRSQLLHTGRFSHTKTHAIIYHTYRQMKIPRSFSYRKQTKNLKGGDPQQSLITLSPRYTYAFTLAWPRHIKGLVVVFVTIDRAPSKFCLAILSLPF